MFHKKEENSPRDKAAYNLRAPTDKQRVRTTEVQTTTSRQVRPKRFNNLNPYTIFRLTYLNVVIGNKSLRPFYILEYYMDYVRKSRSALIGALVYSHGMKNICEIGLSRGDNAHGVYAWLKKNYKYHLDRYFGIDPNIWGRTDKKWRPDPKRTDFQGFVFIEETSDEALKLFKDNSLDLVFVDGDHTPAQVEKDIIGYTKKIKNGGILIGDDYNDFTGAGIKFVVNTIIGKDNIHTQLDERLESGRDNWLWWTYVNNQQYTYANKA